MKKKRKTILWKNLCSGNAGKTWKARNSELMRSILMVLAILVLINTAACPGEEITPELNQLYPRTQYSTGETSDITSSYLILHLPGQNMVWYGFQRANYNVPRASRGGEYSEEYHTFGGYFTPPGVFSYQYDYFRMTNIFAQQTEILGGEATCRLSPPVAAGLGYYSSTYPYCKASQYTARLLLYPSATLTMNTKVIYTETSLGRNGMALQEKLTWSPRPGFSLQLRGTVGRRFHYIDNDISSFYTQYQELQSSCGAQLNLGLGRQGEATLCLGYTRDSFDGYSTQGYTGGLKVYF